MTTENSTYKKIGVASFIMMLSVFSSRIIGLAREMCIAFTGGAGGSVDAYQVAFILPEILNHVVASGFLSVTFIPIFAFYVTNNREEEGWRVFSIIFNTFGLILVILIGIAFCFTPHLVKWLAPGLTEPELFNQAVKMTRIIIPAQFFFFAGGLFMAVQFTKEKFFLPALAPLIYNIGIIVGGILLAPHIGMEGFAWGVLAGAFAGNFIIQYAGAKRVGMRILPIIDLKNPQFVKYILLTLPLMLGLTMTFSTEILLKYFGSFLSEGSIAALNYAVRVMFILVGVFGQAVGVASYPFMAKLASKGEIGELNKLLNNTLRYLCLIIPVAVLFMVLRHEIVVMLFQRGRFDSEATKLTAMVLPFIMAGTVAFAAQTVVVRGYYAMQNTWLPALLGTIAVLLSLPLFFILMKWMNAAGVALALSVSATLNTGVLFTIWNRRTKNFEATSLYLFMGKIILISCGMGIILWQFCHMLQVTIDNTCLKGALAVSILTGLLFFLLFVTAGFIFKIDEISVLLTKLYKRLKMAVFRSV
ncbi:putative integral membrane protein MviN [Desulfamplus magnetovallimortis]|uniref:Probable lipid II flippase MurJ n=1 Tax=Desulfamplus magnetovallimortis TaxID=1246637 RepID=A0A1W1H4L6_9BACT|nr:murein biosynthesis integral membrane protein MurJ [Desulfamplus magnetovallimortis]SLM27396.1 putative integral membrane protein MviN [Desulfamplus magnetovallimortis]